MKVLALDLSLTATGVAHTDGMAETLSPPKGRDSGMVRLSWFRESLWARMIAYGPGGWPVTAPDLVAIEGYSMGAQRGSQGNAQKLGELGGVVRLHLFDSGMPYVDIPPASLKRYATGKGNASKDLVLVEAVKRLDYEGSSKDEADALWLRAMTLDHFGEPVVKVPETHRVALAGVAWPELEARDVPA